MHIVTGCMIKLVRIVVGSNPTWITHIYFIFIYIYYILVYTNTHICGNMAEWSKAFDSKSNG